MDEMKFSNFKNFKARRIIQYSLILCILCIQVIIALFLWSEYKNRKNTTFIENQIKDVDNLGVFANQSKVNFSKANDYYQQYLKTKDSASISGFYKTLQDLTSSLNSIDSLSLKNENLYKVFHKKSSSGQNKNIIKTYIDSITYEVSNPSVASNFSNKIIKYKYQFPKIEHVDVQTETYTDSIQKKKLFGRIKDAIAGKETVRKDSTVVTLKQIIEANNEKSNKIVDSLLANAHKHYVKEINRVQTNAANSHKSDNSKSWNEIVQLQSLLGYSNSIVDFYDNNLKDVKNKLLIELSDQREKLDNSRITYAIIALILMFIVSILLLYFTRLAFYYEKELRKADIVNKEHLNFKNRILGMLSHELRSPLKIIGLFANRIQKKTDDHQIKDYLDSIHFTSNSLLLQANQILEYTKNQSLMNQLVPTEFNLKNEIDHIVESLEPYIESRHNNFVVNTDVPAHLMVNTDKTKINQLYFNIVGNANKFTENGKIIVNTNAIKINDAWKISISVEDTGAGISEADLENIFEPYYQGVISNEVENLGAGLGLSLCKEIVNLFDGDISATSTLGKGTKVSFTLLVDELK